MILGIVYFVMAVVIVIQVINLLKLSDKVDNLRKDRDFYKYYYDILKKENEENKKIIENIKENLPF